MKTELALYQALISINVTEQKANAVIDAWESDMISLLATKADLNAVSAELKTEMAKLDTRIAQLDSRLTIRMGFMMSAIAGIAIAAAKLL